MNKNKKIFIITITILMIIGLTTITATDIDITNTTTTTETNQAHTVETTQKNNTNYEMTSTTKEPRSQTDNIQETTNLQETINNKNREKTQNLKASRTETATTYTDLRNYLTSNTYDTVTINLGNDIQLAGSTTVNTAIKTLTINGNGKTINGNGQYQFLNIAHTSDTLINNITIINCTATRGGAIYCENYSTMTITNSNLTNNTAKEYGGAIYGNNSTTITINNSNLNNNNAIEEFSDGGAIYGSYNSTILITNSNLTNNTATYVGGAICGEGKITIINTNLKHNTANDRGGAIYGFNSNITITNSTLTHNNATYLGGAISVYSSNIAITNTTLNNNTAKSGGAIYGNRNNITIRNSTLNNNNANGEFSDGGAISVFSSNIAITYSSLSHNIANWMGGAIYGLTNNITINMTNLTHNNATYGGAISVGTFYVIYIGTIYEESIFEKINKSSDNIIIINSILNNNNATYGGAIYAYLNTNITITNSTLTHNNAEYHGGAIYGNNTTVDYITIFGTNTTSITITNSNLTNNKANEGGAIYASQKNNLIITNSNLANNTATYGGAIYTNGNLTLRDTNLTYNNANEYGGAIFNTGNLTITQTNLTHNNANSRGGAIYGVMNNNITVQNSNINNNTAESGGAIYGYTDSNITINNTNITNNTANHGGAIYTFENLTITNSNINFNNAFSGAAISGSTGNMILKDSNITNNYVTTFNAYVIEFGISNSVSITDNIFINNTNNKRDMLFSDASETVNLDIHGNTYIDNFLEDNIIELNATVDYNESGPYNYNIDINLHEIYNDTVHNGTLIVYVNGILKNTAEVLNGTSKITLENNDLNKRENNITLEYISQSKHYQNTTTTFIIYKEPSYSVVTVDPVEGVVLDNVTFTANVVDYQGNKVNGGYVIFKVGGKTLTYENGTQIRTPVTNGIAKLSYKAESGWIIDTHPDLSVQATYSGTSLALANRSNTSKVKIYKRNATVQIRAPDDYVNGTLHIDAVIRDQNGGLIDDGVLVFKLNGLTVKYVNDLLVDGSLHIHVKLPFAYRAKKYNLTAVYSNKIYNKATGITTTTLKAIPTYVNTTVTIKNQFSKPVVTGQIYNKFNNAILHGTAVLNIKFDGISYAKKVVVNNGTFSETLEGIPIYKPGTHKVEVTVGANSHYEGLRQTYTTKATAKYNATPIITSITRNKTTTRIQAKIVDDRNKNAQKDLKITIKLNGISFLVNKTVTNGKVDVLVDTSTLKNRTYNLELVSGANSYYNAGKATSELPKY